MIVKSEELQVSVGNVLHKTDLLVSPNKDRYVKLLKKTHASGHALPPRSSDYADRGCWSYRLLPAAPNP